MSKEITPADFIEHPDFNRDLVSLGIRGRLAC